MMRVIVLMIALSIAFPAIVIGQTSDRRDPGIPFSFEPMKSFGTNLPKQTLYFQRLPGISPDYRLGSGDVIRIDATGNDLLNQTFKISNSGFIDYLLLGEIQAAGLTAEELESEIGSRLRDKQLVKTPEVLVYIESYEAKPIYIVGEVDNPGEYVMSQQLTLMDAIFLAGGLDFTASSYGFLHRRTAAGAAISDVPEAGGRSTMFNVLMDGKSPQAGILKNPEIAAPGTEVIKVDLEPVKAGGVFEPNIPLRGGDVFVVPRRDIQYFYVVGDVGKPGPYEIPLGKPLLASQAISYAGGPSKTAKMSEGMLVRYDESGARRESRVDYAAIIQGRQKDFEVHPNDIIFIPGSNAKSLAYGLLGIIPDTVQRTAQ
jgi:polysaccharide biosynthesis/export protein